MKKALIIALITTYFMACHQVRFHAVNQPNPSGAPPAVEPPTFPQTTPQPAPSPVPQPQPHSNDSSSDDDKLREVENEQADCQERLLHGHR